MTKESKDQAEEKLLLNVEVEKRDSKKSDKKQNSTISEEKPSSNKSGSTSIAVFLAIISIVLVVAASYYIYDLQRKQLSTIKSQQQSITKLSKQLSAIESTAKNNTTKLTAVDESLAELEAGIAQTEDISQRAMQAVSRTQREWSIAEVNYLLRMANQRLEIARDITGAIAALKGADSRLAEIGDLNLLKIRKQLAKDIGRLNAIHQADVNGISLAIDEMVKSIPDLPFKSAEDEVKQQLGNESANETTKAVAETGEKTFLDSVVETVKEIGDIKVHKRSIEQASTTEQQAQIEQQLRAFLISARLAALSFDQQQFSYNLNQANRFIAEYYEGTDNRVKQMQESLDAYNEIQLSPELPELTAAWSLLQEEIAKSEMEVEEKVVEEAKK